MKKDSSTFFLGILAAVSTVGFLYKFSKEKDTKMNDTLQGLNIEINPSMLIDSLKPIVMQNVKPEYREALSTATKNLVNGYMNRDRS
jgi:hypothetical protein